MKCSHDVLLMTINSVYMYLLFVSNFNFHYLWSQFSLNPMKYTHKIFFLFGKNPHLRFSIHCDALVEPMFSVTKLPLHGRHEVVPGRSW